MSAFRLNNKGSVDRIAVFDTADVVAIEVMEVAAEIVLARGEDRDLLEHVTVRFRGGGHVALIISIAQCSELMDEMGNSWVQLYD